MPAAPESAPEPAQGSIVQQHPELVKLIGMLPYIARTTDGSLDIQAVQLSAKEILTDLRGALDQPDYLCSVTEDGSRLHQELLRSLRNDMDRMSKEKGFPITGSLQFYRTPDNKLVLEDGRHRLGLLMEDYPEVRATCTITRLSRYDHEQMFERFILPMGNLENNLRGTSIELQFVAKMKVYEYVFASRVREAGHVPTSDEMAHALSVSSTTAKSLRTIIWHTWGLPLRLLMPLPGRPSADGPRMVSTEGLSQFGFSTSTVPNTTEGVSSVLGWVGVGEGGLGRSPTDSDDPSRLLKRMLEYDPYPPGRYPALRSENDLYVRAQQIRRGAQSPPPVSGYSQPFQKFSKNIALGWLARWKVECLPDVRLRGKEASVLGAVLTWKVLPQTQDDGEDQE